MDNGQLKPRGIALHGRLDFMKGRPGAKKFQLLDRVAKTTKERPRMISFLFRSGRLLDPRVDELVVGIQVLVEGECVRELSRPDGPIRGLIHAKSATRIDLGGRTLMAGLIDAHVHIFLSNVRPHWSTPALSSAKQTHAKWFSTRSAKSCRARAPTSL